MIAHSVPFVKFKGVVINLSRVDYAIVNLATDTYGASKKQWKMHIYFSTVVGTTARKLTWNFNNEADANLALEQFESLNEKYVISEFP